MPAFRAACPAFRAAANDARASSQLKPGDSCKGARDSLLLVNGQRAIEARWPKAQGIFPEAPRAEVDAVNNSGAVEKGMDTFAYTGRSAGH